MGVNYFVSKYKKYKKNKKCIFSKHDKLAPDGLKTAGWLSLILGSL